MNFLCLTFLTVFTTLLSNALTYGYLPSAPARRFVREGANESAEEETEGPVSATEAVTLGEQPPLDRLRQIQEKLRAKMLDKMGSGLGEIVPLPLAGPKSAVISPVTNLVGITPAPEIPPTTTTTTATTTTTTTTTHAPAIVPPPPPPPQVSQPRLAAGKHTSPDINRVQAVGQVDAAQAIGQAVGQPVGVALDGVFGLVNGLLFGGNRPNQIQRWPNNNYGRPQPYNYNMRPPPPPMYNDRRQQNYVRGK